MSESGTEVRCGVYEAKTRLSELLEMVAAGQRVVITRRGVDVAQIVSVSAKAAREVGFDRGAVWVAEDFDAPLPDDMIVDIT